MAREDDIDQELQKAISIGRSNQQLMPSVKSWCRHMDLADVSRGLVAEMYGLPINIKISCPHTAGIIRGMVLENISSHFIMDNCTDCPYHDPTTNDNFGTQLLARSRKERAEKDKATVTEETFKDSLRKEIAELARKEKPKAGITQLSVLKYVEGLDQPEDRIEKAELLLKSAGLEPGFFSLLTLRGISYYFDDEAAGHLLMDTVCLVLGKMKDRPAFILSRLLDTLVKCRHLNAVCLLLKFFIDGPNIKDHDKTIRLVIDQCQYERQIGDPGDLKRDYTGPLALLSYLIEKDQAFMQAVLRDRLSLHGKSQRINTHFLLQELFALQETTILSLAPEIVRSLEGENDRYMESADRVNLSTIALLIKSDPGTQYPIIQSYIGKLSSKASGSTIELTRAILRDDAFRGVYPSFCQQMIDEYIDKALSGSVFDKNEELKELRYLSQDYPEFFGSHVNGLLGFLIKVNDEEKTFYYFKEEAETKAPDQQTTFNYLTGKRPWEIMNLKTALESVSHAIKATIENVIEQDPATHGSAVRQLLKSLDSTTQEGIKKALIRILSSAIKDPLVTSTLLSDLYTYLLDAHSTKIRYASIEWLDNIMERFPGLITQTLLDLVDIFIEDADVIIKAKAIRLLGTMSRKMPSRFTQAHMEAIIGALVNQYVGVHKTAASICHVVFSHTDAGQREVIFNSLYILEKVYHDQDPSFCKEVIEQMLRLAADYPKLLDYTVKNYVLPYSYHQDFYIAENFRETLDEIRKAHPVFEPAWLKTTFSFLGGTRLEMGDSEDRGKLFHAMYSLSYKTVQQNSILFDTFIKTRQYTDSGDILQTLDVLSYFEQHSLVIQLCEYLLSSILDTGATARMLAHCRVRLTFSQFDQACQTGSAEKEQLKAIHDALQKI